MKWTKNIYSLIIRAAHFQRQGHCVTNDGFLQGKGGLKSKRLNNQIDVRVIKIFLYVFWPLTLDVGQTFAPWASTCTGFWPSFEIPLKVKTVTIIYLCSKGIDWFSQNIRAIIPRVLIMQLLKDETVFIHFCFRALKMSHSNLTSAHLEWMYFSPLI